MSKLFSRNSANSEQEVAISISAKTFFKLIALAITTVIVLAVLRLTAQALILIFIAFFLSVALNAPVSWVGRHLPGPMRGRRALATSISTLLVLVVIGSFLALVVPPIVKQSQTLVDSAPQLINSVQNNSGDIGDFIARYHLETQVDKFANQLGNRLDSITSNVVSALSTVVTSVVVVLTIIVLTFMMLVEGPYWIKLGRQLVPDQKREWADRISMDMYKVVRGFVNGQVSLALIASIMILPGLLIFDVSYPIALMGVVFIAGLIPMVGHTIGAIIVALVALFTSPLSALGILLYYFLYQQIENYLIQPKVQANSTNMSPLLVFSAVVIGISFSGLIGGLIAIPLAGCLKVLVIDYLYSRKMLEPAPAKAKETNSAKADTK